MNNLIRIAAGALFALAILLAGYGVFLSSRPSPSATAPVAAPTPQASFKTVVVSRALAAGHMLAESDLRVDNLPTQIEGAHASTAELVGKHISIALNQGTPVLTSFIGQRFAYDVPAGQRAIAIRVDDTIGVGHQIQPGDSVDLFVLMKQSGQEVTSSSARLLLSQLRVLAYGQQAIAQGGTGSTATGDQVAARVEPARMAVLAVPVQDVSQVLLAEGSGRLAMALRNPEDTGRHDAGQWTYASALPLKPNAGNKVEDKAFAGVRLDSLSGSPVNRNSGRSDGAAMVASPGNMVGSSMGTTRTAGATRPTVELIRAGKRENVPY